MKGQFCTRYADVAGVERTEIEYDPDKKIVQVPFNPDYEPLSAYVDEQWIELENGERVDDVEGLLIKTVV